MKTANSTAVKKDIGPLDVNMEKTSTTRRDGSDKAASEA
jgi:hypothetical protein